MTEERATYMGDTPQAAIGVRDGRAGWYRVYNHVLDDYGEAMGPYGIAVYSALCRFASSANIAYPSHDRIAKMTGMSRRQVVREIEKLVELKLIARDARSEGNLKQSNIYTILDVPRYATQSHRCDTQSQPDVTHSHNPSDTQSHKEDLVNKTHKNKNDDGGAPPDPWRSVVDTFQQEIGFITPSISDQIKEYFDEVGPAVLIDAFKAAARNNVRKWSYVDGILKKWRVNGRSSPTQGSANAWEQLNSNTPDYMRS